VFRGPAPALPEAFGGLKLTMTADEARRAAREVAAAGPRGLEKPELPGVRFELEAARTKVRTGPARVTFAGDATALKAALSRAWGAPAEHTRGNLPLSVWFNPAEGLRARLHDDSVELSPYVQASDLIGEAKDRLGFETTPVVGAPLAQVQRDHAAVYVPGDLLPVLELLPTEWADDATVVALHTTSGPDPRVASILFDVPYRDDATKAAVFGLFTRKWGPASEVPGEIGTWTFAAAPGVRVTDSTRRPGAFDVSVTAPP
jgi:hypothetical protein